MDFPSIAQFSWRAITATVFVSYCRESHEKARSLAQDLEALGYQTWFDQALTGGQAWWNSILGEIQKCDIFAFALELESLNSAACKREYAYAAKLGKSILPVLIADDVDTELLPAALAQIHFVDYRQEDRVAFRALAKALTALPPSGPLPEPLPEAPPAPVSYLSGLKEQLEASEDLSFAEQTGLVLRLKTGLRNAKDAEQIRTMLKLFRSRDDLYAKVADEIDALLKDAPVMPAAVTPAVPKESDPKPMPPSSPAKVPDSPVPPVAAVNIPPVTVKPPEAASSSEIVQSEPPKLIAPAFRLFSFRHVWLSVLGAMLFSASLGTLFEERITDPALILRAPWAIPAAVLFSIAIVWRKLESRSFYLRLAVLLLPLTFGFLVPGYRPWSDYAYSSPHFWFSLVFSFRSLLALIPLAFVAGALTFAENRLTSFAWVALIAGMFISVILSQNSLLMPPQFIQLVSLILALGFAVYAIVTLVKRMSSKGSQSKPTGEASA